MLSADFVDEQEHVRTGRYACRSVMAKRMAGIVCPVNLPAVGSTDIVMASKRMPGSRISFITLATSGAFSHGAPICSNGRSVPLPSVRLVPSK